MAWAGCPLLGQPGNQLLNAIDQDLEPLRVCDDQDADDEEAEEYFTHGDWSIAPTAGVRPRISCNTTVFVAARPGHL